MKHYSQHGFSILEILVSMLIGIFILGGMMTIYISSKKTYEDRDQIASMEENARSALSSLTRHLQRAGYSTIQGSIIGRENYILDKNDAIKSALCMNNENNVSSPDLFEKRKSQDGADGQSDSVAIRYSADEYVNTDCNEISLKQACRESGSPLDSTWVYSSFTTGFSASNPFAYNKVRDQIPILYCYGSRNTMQHPIAEGIENIQVRYGVDLTDDQESSINVYWNATRIDEEKRWDSVLAIQVGLLVRSVNPFFDTNQSETFQVLDTMVTTNDRYKRAVYSATIRLQNVGG